MSDIPPDAKAIFFEALDQKSPEELIGYLDEACGDNTELRSRVEELLRAHQDAGNFLGGSSPADATIDQPIPEKPGTVIGPYKLLQKIGEGGFGVVYMAEQKEPVKRRVALKIIKPGMDTRQVIARFEAERQALAMMDHPNIAKVLDAGATESGRPYFVMELVNGISVTQYCDEQHLTPKERLELFVPICQAVQHAHQKGIIHRDLKPSNVLVALYDGRPVPKVIDFGVAKATSQNLTEKTMFTQLGQIVGTLEYMSPEQAQRNQLDIDTRSDIYSLGVLLYELLTGNTPFDGQRLRSAAFDEMLRIIREEEPPKPSTRVSSSEALPSIAANRHIEPKKLTSLVRGELDWIVLKAMEKDRARRYETATGFAADIERYLHDEAVVACPPSAAYRFSKFARRNKAVLSVVALLSASLLLGIVGTTWQAIRATRALGRAVTAEERAEAEAASAKTEAAIARAISEFMNEYLLESANPYDEPNRDLTVREVLDRASQRIDGSFADQPLVKARVLYSLGLSYSGLGEYGKAQKHFEQSRDLYQQERGTDDVWTLRARNCVANAINRKGRREEAEKIYRDVLETQRRVLGKEHPETLMTMMNLANANNNQGRYEEAEKICRAVLETQRRVLGKEHAQTVKTMAIQANAITKQGRYEEAEKIHREVLELRQRVLGKEHLDTLQTMMALAVLMFKQERYEEAEKLRRSVLEIRQRTLGEEHVDTLVAMMNLGAAIGRQGRYDEAEVLHREALEIGRRVLGPEHPITLTISHNLANCCTSRSWKLATSDDLSNRDPAKAVELANLAIELQPDNANHWNNLGVAQYRASDWQAATEALEKADAMIDGGDYVHRMFLAMAYWQLGDKQKARELYAQGAAWIAEHRKNDEGQKRFRAEAEELMGLTEEDRNGLIEDYRTRPPDEPSEAPREKTKENERLESAEPDTDS